MRNLIFLKIKFHETIIKGQTFLKKYLTDLFLFFNHIFSNRQLFIDLVKDDFKKKYLGSYLGVFWAFIQPTITILIFWFVFQVGFKSKPVNNVPFVLWLISGMIPWFFFSESLSNATYSIIQNSFLVKKVVFRVSVLPLVKVFSALFVHLFFVIFMMFIFIFYGFLPNLYWLEFFYYLFALIIFVLGLSWITSSLIVFFKDMGEIVSMFLQFGFWMTPIFWSIDIVPEKYQFFLKLNPVYYIVEGYRDTFIYKVWFWEHPYLTLYFWIIALGVFGGGALIFRRLRPHFADVL